MADLKKLFVRVGAGLGITAADVSAKSKSEQKIYFYEDENTIYVNGVAYGMSPAQLEKLEAIEKALGTNYSDLDGSTVIGRILDVSTTLDTILSDLKKMEQTDSDLQDEIDGLKGRVNGIDTSIDRLDTSVNTLESKVSALEGAAKVNLAEGENVLSLNPETLQLSSTIALSVDTEAVEDGKKYIRLTGKDGADLGKIDTADFVKDGMLEKVELVDSSLHFVWNTDGGKTEMDVDLKSFIDTYTVKEGSENFLGIDGYKVEVKTSEIKEGATGLAKASDVYAAIEGVNADNAEKFAEIDASINRLDSSVNTLEGAVSDLDGRLDITEAEIDTLDASVIVLKAKDAEIDASINRLDSSVSTLESLVEQINDKNEDVDASIKRLDSSVNALEEDVKDLKDDVKDIDASISRLDSSVNLLDSSVSKHESQLVDLGVAVDDLAEEIETIDGSIDKLDSSVKDHETRLDAIEAWDPWQIIDNAEGWKE